MSLDGQRGLWCIAYVVGSLSLWLPPQRSERWSPRVSRLAHEEQPAPGGQVQGEFSDRGVRGAKRAGQGNAVLTLVGALACVACAQGLIRIMKKSDESPPPFDLDSLMRPQPYKVRVYVLEGKGLQPKDLNGKSDPYIKVRAVAVRTSSRRLCAYNPDGSHVALARAQLKLGKKTVSDHKNALDSTNDPEFYRCFEMATELPGTSRSSEPAGARVGAHMKWRSHASAPTSHRPVATVH